MAKETEQETENYGDIIEEYFSTHKDFFQNDTAQFIFLEGVLVGFLLESQRIANPEKKTNEPFWGALHDLRLDKRILMDLYPKTVNKLKQLGYSYAGLVKEVSAYMQRAGSSWALTPVEMSWYFSHGLASYQNFKKTKKDTK